MQEVRISPLASEDHTNQSHMDSVGSVAEKTAALMNGVILVCVH